jgi:GTP-binding protein
MIDVAYIKLKGGNGGDGAVSFRHEKYIAKGGPDGGDGGKGGDVYFVADNNLGTLKDFKSKEVFKADDGEPGGKKKMTGKDGSDVFIKVPQGTIVYEIKGDREILVCDLSEVEQKYLVVKGGIGGRGNHRFKSSINQVPLQYTPGIKGEEKRIKLEIRLVADVGLIGMPNAGKSTLINRLTNANAKVASYPFTTLTPNLGMCKLKDESTIVLSDIPGLIEGASRGKGLGDEFLRHVQRTRVLVHLVDVSDSTNFDAKTLIKDATNKYEVIRNELEDYDSTLAKKNEVVVINKIDVTEIKEALPQIIKSFKKNKVNILGISAVTGEGIEDLLEEIRKILDVTPKVIFEAVKATKVYNIDNLPNRKVVFKQRRVIELVRPKH